MRFLTCRVLVGYLRGRVFDLPHECSCHPILGDVDSRLGYPVVVAQLTSASYAAPDLLDQPHTVKHAEHASTEWPLANPVAHEVVGLLRRDRITSRRPLLAGKNLFDDLLQLREVSNSDHVSIDLRWLQTEAKPLPDLTHKPACIQGYFLHFELPLPVYCWRKHPPVRASINGGHCSHPMRVYCKQMKISGLTNLSFNYSPSHHFEQFLRIVSAALSAMVKCFLLMFRRIRGCVEE